MDLTWHRKWQSLFAQTEVTHAHRRADALNNNRNVVIEFQHSYITLNEVNSRTKDWNLAGKTVVWVVDGNDEDFIDMNNDRVFIDFKNTWKYKSFLNCDHVFLSMHESVYKLYPLQVKSHLIEMFAIPVNHFIQSLHDETFQEHNTQEHVRTQVYIKQQGAGNGKTFGVVQLIKDPVFAHVRTFVYLTKQHSAKYVIKNEIYDQRNRGILDVSNISEAALISNKYVITFLHKDITKKIIIGTFDSFVYALGDKNVQGINHFHKMAQSIVDQEIRCNDNGTIYYAGNVRLNKQLLLIGDEMQDLETDYTKALLKISREKYVDVYAVGDRLQSISLQNNAFTFLLDYELPEPIFEIVRYPLTNQNRRIVSASRSSMIPFINRIVPFEKFGLPPIEHETTTNSEYTNESVVVILGKDVFDNHDYINDEVNILMMHYANEVNQFGRKPNDFLIVTSCVKKNPLIEAFHTEIRKFWESRQETHQYTKWSVFHKSEEGHSIDLEDSVDATRIVSIHSSKGDGRPVVFVMDMCEPVFIKYSDVPRNLVYESLLHVALTRAKEKMYIRVSEKKECDLSRRLLECAGLKCVYSIPKTFTFDVEQLLENNESVYEDFKHVLNTPQLDCRVNPLPVVMDMKHHIARGITQVTLVYLCVLETFQSTQKNQHIQMVLKTIQKYTIQFYESSEYHRKLRMIDDTEIIPVLNYKSFGGNYKNYYTRIINSIQKIKKQDIRIDNLDLLDMLVLSHIIQVYMQKQFTVFTITDLYDIVHAYMSMNPTDKELYEQEHYHTLVGISALVRKLHKDYPDMQFALNNYIRFNGGSDDFCVGHEFNMIGRNKDTALLVDIKPHLSGLNLTQTTLNAAFYIYLAKNSTKNASTHAFDFKDKRIRMCVLAFGHDPVYLDVSDFSCAPTLHREVRKSLTKYHEIVYHFLSQVKNPRTELLQWVEKHTNHYIKRYITGLDEQIQDADSPEEYMAQVIHDKEKFLALLNRRLETALAKYFNI